MIKKGFLPGGPILGAASPISQRCLPLGTEVSSVGTECPYRPPPPTVVRLRKCRACSCSRVAPASASLRDDRYTSLSSQYPQPCPAPHIPTKTP